MLNFSEFSGSPYHIGLALGKAGASAMHDLITPSALWQQLLLWRDSDELRALQDQVQQHHPYIWDELQGLARGLELPPDDVFLWNVQGTLPQRCPQDIDNAGHPDTDPETDAHAALGADADAEVHEGVDTNRPIGYTAVESTTLLIPTAEGPRIVHHMAGDPAVADCCGVAEFIVDQGPEFAAFVSPGMLPGHAVTVTGSGLCIAVNATLPQELGKGVPAIVLTRALLNMPDISSAIQLLNDSPRCGGRHISLAQRGGSALLGIEITPEHVSIQHAKTPTLHTNHLIHDMTADVAQTISPSSQKRLDAGRAWLGQHPEGQADPLRLMADLAPEPHDAPARTLLTADLHVHQEHVDWDVYEGIDEPARFRMRDAKHI